MKWCKSCLLPDTRPNINRGRITSRKDDNVKDVSIGIQDHDEAIMYYFKEVIKPSVIITSYIYRNEFIICSLLECFSLKYVS